MKKTQTKLPPGIYYLDRGNLLIVKKPILNFVRVIIKKVCESVNNESLKKLGLKMTKVAKLKLCDRQTKFMF